MDELAYRLELLLQVGVDRAVAHAKFWFWVGLFLGISIGGFITSTIVLVVYLIRKRQPDLCRGVALNPANGRGR